MQTRSFDRLRAGRHLPGFATLTCSHCHPHISCNAIRGPLKKQGPRTTEPRRIPTRPTPPSQQATTSRHRAVPSQTSPGARGKARNQAHKQRASKFASIGGHCNIRTHALLCLRGFAWFHFGFAWFQFGFAWLHFGFAWFRGGFILVSRWFHLGFAWFRGGFVLVSRGLILVSRGSILVSRGFAWLEGSRQFDQRCFLKINHHVLALFEFPTQSQAIYITIEHHTRQGRILQAHTAITKSSTVTENPCATTYFSRSQPCLSA